MILTGLIPYLKLKKQSKVINLEINWALIIDWQVMCLKSGINGVGIPDLIIAQNAFQYNCDVCSLDKHFQLLNKVLNIKVYK